MQFLAVRSGCRPPVSLALNYEYKLSVECCRCKAIYKLWVPLQEVERGFLQLQDEWLNVFTLPQEVGCDSLQVQDQWLNRHLARVCPDHSDYFLTPDLSEAPQKGSAD